MIGKGRPASHQWDDHLPD